MAFGRQRVRQDLEVARVAGHAGEAAFGVGLEHARGQVGQAERVAQRRQVQRDREQAAVGLRHRRAERQPRRRRRQQQAFDMARVGARHHRHGAVAGQRLPAQLHQQRFGAVGGEGAVHAHAGAAAALLVVQQHRGRVEEMAAALRPVEIAGARRIGGRGQRQRLALLQRRGDLVEHRLLLVHAAELPAAERREQHRQHQRQAPAQQPCAAPAHACHAMACDNARDGRTPRFRIRS